MRKKRENRERIEKNDYLLCAVEKIIDASMYTDVRQDCNLKEKIEIERTTGDAGFIKLFTSRCCV